MPPPFPTAHRGMTANPLKPGRYRPGKPIAEEQSSDEDEEEEEEAYEEEAQRAKEEEDRRRRAETQRRQRQQQQQQQPKASSFPAGAAAGATGGIAKGVRGVRIDEENEEGEDEEGFVTDEDEGEQEEQGHGQAAAKAAPRVTAPAAPDSTGVKKEEQEEEESEEEEESSEEESSEDERPQRVLLRPTFIKKDKRKDNTTTAPDDTTTTAVKEETQAEQRKAKTDLLIRDQLEKQALERSAASKQWDDDEAEAAEEAAINDEDNLDPAAEHAAWKLRELQRVKRSREAIEASEKEREEIERRRNLTADERAREDNEFLAKQKEEKEATRGQPGFMQRYFHKGAFFNDELAREGLDRRNVMGRRFVDDVGARETLPEYMQVRDLTQIGKKGRTKYRDLRTEDTGRFGEGLDRRGGPRRDNAPPIGVTDERFMPDRERDGPKGPTGANASVVRERRRSRERSYSPRRRDRGGDRDCDHGDSYRPAGGSRKRSPSPYDNREKRRRMESAA